MRSFENFALARDGEVAGERERAGARLSASEGDRVVAGKDHVISLFVHLTQRTRIDFEREVR